MRSFNKVSGLPSLVAPSKRPLTEGNESCSTISPFGSTTSAPPDGTLGPPQSRPKMMATGIAIKMRFIVTRRAWSTRRQVAKRMRIGSDRGLDSMGRLLVVGEFYTIFEGHRLSPQDVEGGKQRTMPIARGRH